MICKKKAALKYRGKATNTVQKIEGKRKYGFHLSFEFQVNATFLVEDLLEVDDGAFAMTIELKILISWRDPRLSEFSANNLSLIGKLCPVWHFPQGGKFYCVT